MSIGSFATEGRVDVQGNELNIGDKVYVAVYNDNYRKRDCNASLDICYVVGGYENKNYVNVSNRKPFGVKGHPKQVYTKNCILIKE